MMTSAWSPWLKFGVLGAVILLVIFTTRHSYQPGSFDLGSSLKSQKSSGGGKWLIATMCPASAFSRRNVIRSTWQRLYKNEAFEPRFILSEYESVWEPLIKKENETYGDIVKLDGLDPSPQVSNRIKAMELFKHLVAQGKQYSFVSKVDDDSFLEAGKFYDEFLEKASPTNETLISIKNRNEKYPDFDWPGGAFYTLSWGLVEHIARIHSEQKDTETPEDVRVGKYLSDAKVDFDFVDLKPEEMLEIPIQGARIPHKINRKTILVHFLKDDETYLRVAGVFDGDGYTGQMLEDWTDSKE